MFFRIFPAWNFYNIFTKTLRGTLCVCESEESTQSNKAELSTKAIFLLGEERGGEKHFPFSGMEKNQSHDDVVWVIFFPLYVSLRASVSMLEVVYVCTSVLQLSISLLPSCKLYVVRTFSFSSFAKIAIFFSENFFINIHTRIFTSPTSKRAIRFRV